MVSGTDCCKIGLRVRFSAQQRENEEKSRKNQNVVFTKTIVINYVDDMYL
jgi:hypothetical protein